MTTTVVWSEDLLTYDLGDHPLDPVRVELTMALARDLGILARPGVRMVTPASADDAAIMRVHEERYVQAVKAAPDELYFGQFGLGTGDNPVFDRMHEASALVAGATIAAAEAVWRGETLRAVNVAGGLHHAMPDRASGFCVYNDPAIAIARRATASASRSVSISPRAAASAKLPPEVSDSSSPYSCNASAITRAWGPSPDRSASARRRNQAPIGGASGSRFGPSVPSDGQTNSVADRAGDAACTTWSMRPSATSS